MTTEELIAIRDSNAEACKIIDEAQRANVHCDAVWRKLFNAKKYLEKQSRDQLNAVLYDGDLNPLSAA